MPDQKPFTPASFVLIAAGLSLLSLPNLIPIQSYSQNIIIIAGVVLVYYGFYRRLFSRERSEIQLAKTGVFFGYLVILTENIRLLCIDTPLWQQLISTFILLCVFLGGMSIFLLVYRPRKWSGRIFFILLLILAGFIRDAASCVGTFIVLLALVPFSCMRKFPRRELTILALLNAGMIAWFHYTMKPSIRFIQQMTESWSLVPDSLYSGAMILIRAVAWLIIGAALFIPLKPKTIRGRLRLAFLLNFIIPVGLLVALGIFSSLMLIGGYQIAAAKRLMMQIGNQARGQAFQLWEAVQGTSREAPARSPFKRAGVAMFEDGSIQEFGDPPWELVEKLSSESAQDLEFLTVNSPAWEVWITGFYRAPDQSGTAVAYRIDDVMLDYIKQVIGFDLIMTPGLDWSFLPFGSIGLGASSIATFDPATTVSEKRFAIGGILISKIQMEDINESGYSVKPYATLKVIASRQLLTSSLLMAGNLPQVNFLLDPKADTSIRVLTAPGQEAAEDAQSVNILGIVIFLLLGLAAGIFVALIILSLFSSFLISRKINRSVRLIRDGTAQLRKGNLDHKIPVVSEDELGQLAENFNIMAESLKQYQLEREIFLLQEAEQNRLKQEFETAQILQRSLLPSRSPEHPSLEIAGVCLPAAEVGGDYYDYLLFYDQALGLAIGDVSGHGMSAGLLMSMAKSCLYNQTRVASGIEDVIRSLNSMVHDAVKQRMLMTFLYAVFSPDGRSMEFASAGHHFPYKFDPKVRSLEELESVSYPLGVRPDIAIQTRQVGLCPGEVLVFYTDGIVEVQNASGELFGFERLEQAIRASDIRNAHDIRDGIIKRVHDFRGIAPIIDDITLIIVKVKEPV